MMCPYIILLDKTEIVYSRMIEEDGKQEAIIHFEGPTEERFDSARCKLPGYEWILKGSYSDEEITVFKRLLRNNAHLLYKYAINGGI